MILAYYVNVDKVMKIDGNRYSIEKGKLYANEICGIGTKISLFEDRGYIGFYIDDKDELVFLKDGETIVVDENTISMENIREKNGKRKLIIRDKSGILFSLMYDSIIDIDKMIYESDEDDEDHLLGFSNLLLKKESIKRFIKYKKEYFNGKVY